MFFFHTFPIVSNCAWAYLWMFLSQLFSVSDFLVLHLSVIPITVKCPNHFRSLSWWDEKMPMSTLDTQKCTSRFTKQKRGAFLVCFWHREDVLLSFSAVGPLVLRLIFTLFLNCCVFVVASVCPPVCSGEIAPKKRLIIVFLCLYQDFSPPQFSFL